ncbi:MAG TPA: hypothetical protein VF796_29570 [Humisphaera sp.]
MSLNQWWQWWRRREEVRWKNGWRAFDAPEKEEDFLRELQSETGEENRRHPLHGKRCSIIGWDGGRKDFILHLPSEGCYAYVHLTYSPETDPRFPWCRLFVDARALNAFLANGEVA